MKIYINYTINPNVVIVFSYRRGKKLGYISADAVKDFVRVSSIGGGIFEITRKELNKHKTKDW